MLTIKPWTKNESRSNSASPPLSRPALSPASPLLPRASTSSRRPTLTPRARRVCWLSGASGGWCISCCQEQKRTRANAKCPGVEFDSAVLFFMLHCVNFCATLQLLRRCRFLLQILIPYTPARHVPQLRARDEPPADVLGPTSLPP